MKKTKIITAAVGFCVVASMMAGCSSQGGSTGGGETAAATRIEGGQTQISVEATVGDDTSAEGEYGFKYNGYTIMPGTKTDEAIAILGDDYEPYEGASCAGQGMDVVYTYSGLQLGAYRGTDNVELIQVIEIEDSIYDCGGIHVGDSLTAAKGILGTPDAEDDFGVIYKGTKTQLQIITDGADKIVAIVYRVAG